MKRINFMSKRAEKIKYKKSGEMFENMKSFFENVIYNEKRKYQKNSKKFKGEQKVTKISLTIKSINFMLKNVKKFKPK